MYMYLKTQICALIETRRNKYVYPAWRNYVKISWMYDETRKRNAWLKNQKISKWGHIVFKRERRYNEIIF